MFNSFRRYVAMLMKAGKSLNKLHQDSARAALVLNGNELEAGLSLNVYISNPERKKERTDAGADQKEIYVAGLSRFTKQTDLQKLFKTVSQSP
jgi:hypothetical protein